MSDLIKITGLSFFAYHGVYAFETKNGQEFVVNARLWLDAADAAREDNLDKSVNYGAVCDLIVSYLQQHTFKLLEAAVYHVMKEILIQFPLIKQMEFELCKPQAPIAHPFENVSVTMEMGWHTAYIALGSNMGDKERYILDAVRKLEDDTDFRSIHMSRLIVTKPYGGVAQDDFVNGALWCETLLSPKELLARLNALEAQAERKREIHWGPRTLDLDIIFYDDLVMDDSKLTIPHADMHNRTFVLEPLHELCPYFRHPVLKKTIEELYLALQNKEQR